MQMKTMTIILKYSQLSQKKLNAKALLPFPFLPLLPKPPTPKRMNSNIAYATTTPTPISLPHHVSYGS
jgi:hypothetical protein